MRRSRRFASSSNDRSKLRCDADSKETLLRKSSLALLIAVLAGPATAEPAPSAAKVRAGATVNSMRASPPSVVSVGGPAMFKPQETGVGGKSPPAVAGVGGPAVARQAPSSVRVTTGATANSANATRSSVSSNGASMLSTRAQTGSGGKSPPALAGSPAVKTKAEAGANSTKPIPPNVASIGGRKMLKPGQTFVGGKMTGLPEATGAGDHPTMDAGGHSTTGGGDHAK